MDLPDIAKLAFEDGSLIRRPSWVDGFGVRVTEDGYESPDDTSTLVVITNEDLMSDDWEFVDFEHAP